MNRQLSWLYALIGLLIAAGVTMLTIRSSLLWMASGLHTRG
jgi:hypothetical protein